MKSSGQSGMCVCCCLCHVSSLVSIVAKVTGGLVGLKDVPQCVQYGLDW